MQPRGYRLLSKIPRLPESVVERVVAHFGNLQKIMRATIDDLDDVDGVGESRARAIKEGLVPPHRVEHPRPLRLVDRLRALGGSRARGLVELDLADARRQRA